jgi:hypothetical protein
LNDLLVEPLTGFPEGLFLFARGSLRAFPLRGARVIGTKRGVLDFGF